VADRLLEFGLRAAAESLPARLDAGLAEVALALERARVRCVLLKGPAIAGWLYGPGELRKYRDIDLLVGEHQLGAAERVLARLGFARGAEPDPVLRVDRWHRVWQRKPDGAVVELHWTLVGARVSAKEVWSVLGERTDQIVVEGTPVSALSLPARAMHLALHAAQHGGVGRPREDLERGIGRLEFGVWQQARDLAARVDAMSPFAAGFRSCPAGAELEERLGLPEPNVYWGMRARAPEGAGRLWYLRHAQTWRDRWRLVVWFLPQTRDDAAPAGLLATIHDIARAAGVALARLRGAIRPRRGRLAAWRFTRSGCRAGPRPWGLLRRVRLRG
jgi:Uncharacterised nucleotidyltransferase